VVYVTDEATGAELLCNALRGNNDIRGTKTVVSMGVRHTERQLHQIMFADQDYERVRSIGICRR